MPEDKLLSALKASESEKNFDKTRIEKIAEEIKKLEHRFSKLEIKEIRKSPHKIENENNLFDEDYYKPVITNSTFNSGYIQYESIEGEGKDKNLSINKYLDKIKPYLSDMINNQVKIK